MLAGAALVKPWDLATRLPFVVPGRIDGVLHLRGDKGGRVIPLSWGD